MQPRWLIAVVISALALWSGAALAEDAGGSDARAFAAAQQLLDAGDTTQAFEAFGQFLRDYPVSPLQAEARLRQAICAYHLGRWTTARELFQQLAARLTPSDPLAMREAVTFYLAEVDYREGRYPAAIAQYQAIIASARPSPYKEPAQLGLGWAYYQQGRCEESFAAFESLRRGGAGAAQLQGATLFALGDCARRLGRPEEAMAAFQQLVTRDPSSAWADEAALALSELLIARQREAAARTLCEEMLRTHAASPLAPGFHVHAGNIALKHGELEAARAHFQDVASHATTSPFFIAALVGLGDVAFEAGDFSEAARQYARVVLYAPHGPYAAYALFQQAQALFSADQWSRARHLYEQLIAAHPSSRFVEQAHLRLGDAWAVEGRAEEAISQYAQVLSRFPETPSAARAQLGWADVLARAGRWQEAERLYAELIQRTSDPEVTALAMIRQAQTLSARGEALQAEALILQALEHAPPPAARAEAHLTLARWAMERQEWPMAERALAEALAAGGGVDAEVRFWQGWVAFQRQDWLAAVASWETLATQHSHHARTVESRPWWLLATIHAHGVRSALATLESWLPHLQPGELAALGRQVAGGLRDEGLAEEAIEVYTFLMAHAPEASRPEWWFLAAEAYEEAHDRARAIAAYRRAAEAHPAQPWAARGALAAARLLEDDHQWSAAMQLYRQASAANSPEAVVARERLQQLEARQP